MTNNYRVICAIIAWVALSLTYVDIAQSGRHPGAVASAGAFLVFFTVLTNILVAVAFTAPLLNPDGKFRNFFMRPAVRTAIAICIFNTAVVYHVVLASHYDPQGLTYWRHISLNTIMPTLYILDWLFVAKKQPLSYSQIPYWIIYPTAYGICLTNSMSSACNAVNPSG